MDKIAETLKGYYEASINQPRPLAFYSGLADYAGYIVETPALKTIADDIMKKKKEMYDELDRLENKALEEIQEAKKKLLKIIKDNKIDPALLSQRMQTAPGAEGNVLDHIKKYENGEIGIAGFKSSVIESYLFDIAANLTRLGYGAQVQPFVVSGEQYGHHYDDPEQDKAYRVAGNIHGNFIFSKTIIERIRQQARIERCEKFELWGAFNALLKLHQAFSTRSKGLGSHNVMEEYLTQGKGRNRGENKDLVETIWIFEDLGSLTVDNSTGTPARKERFWYLDEDEYKGFAARTHSYLLKKIAETEAKKTGGKTTKEIILYLTQDGDLYREPRSKYCYKMGANSDRCEILRYLAINRGYQQTSCISSALGEKNEKSLRNEIGKIKVNIKKLLKIDGNQVIGSKKESGYRIKLGCKIVLKDE